MLARTLLVDALGRASADDLDPADFMDQVLMRFPMGPDWQLTAGDIQRWAAGGSKRGADASELRPDSGQVPAGGGRPLAIQVEAELLARLSTRGDPAAIAVRDLGRYYVLLAQARRELRTSKAQLTVLARILAAGGLEVSEAALLFLDHLVRIRAQYRYAGSDYAKLLRRLAGMTVLERLALIDAAECQLQAARRTTRGDPNPQS